MARRAASHSGRARSPGFTLIEVLVALVIFGVITVALSFTFDTALVTQQANTHRLEELGAVRSVFDYMERDIRQAFATSTDASSVFIASSGSQSGPQSAGASGLLTLVARGNRLLYDPQNPGTGPAAGPASNSTAAVPQSESAMIRYDFDPHARTLSRTVLTVPNLQLLQQTPPSSDTVICNLVDDISLRFWDNTQQSWRTDWDYEQQNQQSTTGGAAGGTSSVSGAGSAATVGGSSTTPGANGSGDTYLPSSVEITVTIRHQDGTTATYVSTVPLVTFPVDDGMAPPTNNGTTSGSTAAPGTS